MNRHGSEAGFAIALLLWMIAGMSLTVAAVLHFAKADTSMVELRIREAKARAIGRGAAMLALRDSAMSAYMPEDAGRASEQELQSENGGYENPGESGAQYEFKDGWSVSVTMRPSNGYVSLNDAEAESLERVFVELGGMGASAAARMAQGVVDYRYVYPGFRYREELLAVDGVSRHAYDRVKDYVHPFRSGQLSAASAVAALGDILPEDAAVAERGESSNTDFQETPGGMVTFESVAAKIEQRSGVSDTTITALEMRHEIAGDVTLEQIIWASPERMDPILRVGSISIARVAEQ